MAGRISNLSLTPGNYSHAANAQIRTQASSSASAPPAIQETQEVDSSYGTQVKLLTRLKGELRPGGITEECHALFSKLDPHVQFRSYQCLCPNSQDKQEIINKGIDLFLRNPAALSGKIEDLLLYVKSRVPALEERTQAVAGCCGMPSGVATLISKYAMERFDDEIFGRQQWIDCWGAKPVIFTKTLPELRGLVNLKVISGAQTEKPAEEMNEVECVNFLGDFEVCREENPEPPEELYTCLNRRVRSQDPLLAGFSCVVTYIPQYVRKENRVLAVTARSLSLDLGPNPLQGWAAKLLNPAATFNHLLTPEDEDCTESSCYFIIERDVDPNMRGKEPSVLIEEVRKQGDKGWQLPEPRNFFATVFCRCAWKKESLYGRKPWTLTYGQGKSRNGAFLIFGGSGADPVVYPYTHSDDLDDRCGAAGSRKFQPLALGH